MNPYIARLHPYPFERLAMLIGGVEPPLGKAPISLSIGEPRHAPPAFIVEALARYTPDGLSRYPVARGLPELRAAMVQSLTQRYGLAADALDPDRQVLPVTGTREGLFSLIQAVIDPRLPHPTVVMPNPFYQIYEGATLLAGAEPWYLNTPEETDFLPDFDAVPNEVWERCQALVLCSPGNPTGAVMSAEDWQTAFALADRHDFIIVADECYADLYTDEAQPPVGALQAAVAAGRNDFERLVTFHSLSKRSSVPGLRSGLVAGATNLIEPLALYRTYHGCALAVPAQQASIEAWRDTAHVVDNRHRYQTKFEAARRILGAVTDVRIPPAAFYLWLKVADGDDERFARELYAREVLITLPGRYLSRPTPAGDPGAGHVRVSLVPDEATCEEALTRLARFVSSYSG
ncbi:MAG: succinyldiaminopimelate transaminase [Gammaproteobacteria bacterium]